ncbi:Bacterial protein of unknown function (DUF948) [Candidatus Rhabdochlamydia oedothoracis]|uniref:DUF948 domain-containing protein n=1 Tax=Candidatus Rhabdochlamydia oedothoracis TaxID=2720720 RepID=A0ABX8V6D9_9BACT|nr:MULTISPECIES: DUF948 domain-containing protein [Rhabdochlamydia]KAG6559694.1 hypothetical protein RHOW815_000286 [Candidatus Rhabdochlamydia sp. W815]MCL6756678.1 DUF948 domain-containing protein [Candidatus Rhabdochlamydia oedothoracis]QYF48595.1 Bacterial protein of unknown function (DUF948) [Candidatus Rhabdochlamydia oedothoracis]
MIIEVCVAVSTIAFVILVIFLIMTLRNSCATLKKTKNTLTKVEGELKEISAESLTLLKNVNDLTVDIKEKSEALNFLFDPLLKLSHGKSHKAKNSYEKLTEVINYVADAVILLKK